MGALYLKNGKVLLNGEFKKTDVLIEDGKIKSFDADEEDLDSEDTIDLDGLKILPGFIDIHTHGGGGIDSNSATEEEFKKLQEFYASKGVTSFLPTLLTDTEETIVSCLEKINSVMKEDVVGSEILGVHIEGPYLCEEYKGSMPSHLLALPSEKQFMKFKKASGDNIKLMTVSPEVEGAIDFISFLESQNVIVSMGHSGADYETAMKAIESGVKSSTHTFNAMGPIHQHRPGILGATFESDIYSEIICDGRHLHPGIVRLIYKIKGADRAIAVTDSIMAAGLSDGKYKLGVNDIVVIDGDAQLADLSSRAGSTLTMIQGLKNTLEFTGKPLEEIIKIFTKNPASLINVYDKKGSIEIEKDADLVVLDEENDVKYTIVNGKLVYQA